MALELVNTGSSPNSGDGDTLYVAFTKVNNNFIELYDEQFSGSYNDLTDKPTLFSGSYNDLSDKPVLFDGNYNNLSNLPDLTQYISRTELNAGTVTIDVNNTGDLVGSVYADDSTLLLDSVNKKFIGDIETTSIYNDLDIEIMSADDVSIITSSGNNNYEWFFNSGGYLDFPTNGDLYFNGDAGIQFFTAYDPVAGTTANITIKDDGDTAYLTIENEATDGWLQIQANNISIGESEDTSQIGIGQHNVNNTTTTNIYGDVVFRNGRNLTFVGSNITFDDNLGSQTPTIDFTNAEVLGLEQQGFVKFITNKEQVLPDQEAVVSSFAISEARSAKFYVQTEVGTNFRAGEIMLVHSGTSVDIIEYSVVEVGVLLGDFKSDIVNINGVDTVRLIYVNNNTETSDVVVRRIDFKSYADT